MNIIKQKVRIILKYIHAHVHRRAVFIGVFVVSFGVYLALFTPRTIVFSYSGDNCTAQLSVFPAIVKANTNQFYELSITDTVKIAGYPVIGRNVCVEPRAAPKQGKVKVAMAPFGGWFARKTFIVETPQAPLVSVASLSESIPVAESVKVPISAKDTVYNYDLVAGKARTGCTATERALACDISTMQLVQGESYALKVERHLDEYRETLGEKKVKVLDPVKIEQSSVSAGQVVYDTPASFTLQANKPLGEVKAALERIDGDVATAEKATVTVKDAQIIITPSGGLARDTEYRLQLTNAKGADGSILATPYSVSFRLSGGPKVTGVNIGTSGVNQGQAITVQLDQPIRAADDITQFVRVEGATGASVTKSGDKVLIRLNSIGACTAFTITVSKGLTSEYGVASTSGWQYGSRTRCSTVTTIGYSVNNRPINAYSFGSGASTILFTGAIHGNELSSKYVMEAWIAYLEEHAQDIPADRRVVIIPSVNPDGVAARTRNNVHNVNLNRNFATANWSSDTQSGGGTEKGVGGSSAMSEPETVALADFTQRLQPRFVVTYHSAGSIVNSNDVGIAASLGPAYANMAGYRFVASTQTGDAFGYEVTGTYEDWLAERSLSAILIELPTDTGRYFTKNVDAMWAMVRG